VKKKDVCSYALPGPLLFADNLAVRQGKDAVGSIAQRQIVARDDDTDAVIAHQRPKQVKNRAAVLRIQVPESGS
jgi:hypothetical protein